MRSFDAFRVLIAFLVLVLLQYTVRPMLGWPYGPDFLLVALLVVAVRVRPGTAAAIGLLVGIVSDSIGTGPFGAASLVMAVVAFGASWLQSVVFSDDLTVNAMLFFFGEWAFAALYLLIARSPGSPIVMPALVWAPVAGAITALFGVATLMVLRPILRPVNG